MQKLSHLSLSVVLPTFNEEENIVQTVENALIALKQYIPEYEIIIVNDGSRDETGNLTAKLAEAHDTVRVIKHPVNRGYGGALRSGFEASTKEFVFFTDSDGQFRFDEIQKFIPLLGEYDMLLGFREDRQDPWFRKLNSRIGNLLARLMLEIHVRDINCAFKFFRRSLLQDLPLRSQGAFINTEILAYARRSEWSLFQLPVKHYPRLRGNPTGAHPAVILKTFKEYFELKERLLAGSHTTPLRTSNPLHKS